MNTVNHKMIFARNSLPELVFFLKSRENLIFDGYDSFSDFQQNSLLEIYLIFLFLSNINLMIAFCPPEVRLCIKAFGVWLPKLNLTTPNIGRFALPRKNSTSRHCQQHLGLLPQVSLVLLQWPVLCVLCSISQLVDFSNHLKLHTV